MDATIAQSRPARAPRPKVVAAGVGGAGATVILWVLGIFGLNATPEVAAALTTLIACCSGYLRLDRLAA